MRRCRRHMRCVQAHCNSEIETGDVPKRLGSKMFFGVSWPGAAFGSLLSCCFCVPVWCLTSLCSCWLGPRCLCGSHFFRLVFSFWCFTWWNRPQNRHHFRYPSYTGPRGYEDDVVERSVLWFQSMVLLLLGSSHIRQGDHQNASPLAVYDFLYELLTSRPSYFSFRSLFSTATIFSVSSNNFDAVMKFMVELVALIRRIIYVFGDENLSRQVICASERSISRFQQHDLFCVEHRFLMPL